MKTQLCNDLFLSLEDTRSKVEVWRMEYNHNRPHSALSNFGSALSQIARTGEVEVKIWSWLCRNLQYAAPNLGSGIGSLARLSDDLGQRVLALSQARSEPPEEILIRFDRKSLRHCPKRFSPMIAYLRKAQFEASGIRDGLAYVALPNGRTIYGHRSRPNHVRQYQFVSDLVSPTLTAETFLLGLNVATRYRRDNFDAAFAFAIKPGDTIVEVGAYVGHLSMWFAESVGASGRVVAIEMMPDNAQILKRNVLENGMQAVITVVNSGAWHSPGEYIVKTKGMQMNTLASIESLKNADTLKLPVDTLDNILEGCGITCIDVAFITVNGAELDVLEGFRHYLPKTRAIAIAAPYNINGKSNADMCASVLCDHNFTIVPTRNSKLVLAAQSDNHSG